jgi:hypothetical protein
MMSSKNRDCYFWQYNIQSKGPKTKKALTLRSKDPHFHRDFFDPVFQLQTLNARTAGSTSLNKLRKGDGNDVTPNADKLYNLGNQIRDFIQKSYQMNSAFFTPQQQQAITGGSIVGGSTPPPFQMAALSSSFDNSLALLPPKERVNLKREKNKIASRACRLKKKAQHEANKIKLSGLNDEHKQLIEAISAARNLIKTRLVEPQQLPPDKKMVELIDDVIQQKIKTKIAGNSDGYVHSLMLQIEKNRSTQTSPKSKNDAKKSVTSAAQAEVAAFDLAASQFKFDTSSLNSNSLFSAHNYDNTNNSETNSMDDLQFGTDTLSPAQM